MRQFCWAHLDIAGVEAYWRVLHYACVNVERGSERVREEERMKEESECVYRVEYRDCSSRTRRVPSNGGVHETS